MELLYFNDRRGKSSSKLDFQREEIGFVFFLLFQKRTKYKINNVCIYFMQNIMALKGSLLKEMKQVSY